MKKEHILEHLGLNEKESAIYLALIDLGHATISRLSQRTNIHRPALYALLPEMKAKGLIFDAKEGKRRIYTPAPPETLEALFNGFSAQFHGFIPELQSKYESIESRTTVKYLSGKKEIGSIFLDLVTLLKHGDVFYRYSSAKDIERANAFLPDGYREKRDKKQLERYVITNEAGKKVKKQRLERDIKIIPKEYDPFDQDVTQIIYGRKVALIDYNTQTAILIENEKIAEFQRKLFVLLYKKLP